MIKFITHFALIFSVTFLALMVMRGHSWFTPIEDGSLFAAFVLTFLYFIILKASKRRGAGLSER